MNESTTERLKKESPKRNPSLKDSLGVALIVLIEEWSQGKKGNIPIIGKENGEKQQKRRAPGKDETFRPGWVGWFAASRVRGHRPDYSASMALGVLDRWSRIPSFTGSSKNGEPSFHTCPRLPVNKIHADYSPMLSCKQVVSYASGL